MQWEPISPSVNAEAEFFEILNDFGNPLEIVREAISNAIDAAATEIEIEFAIREIDGNKRSVIRFADNGVGMTPDVLRRDFWGLGHSTSRLLAGKIGEKGHGTKIFLRSECVEVRTQTANDEAYHSRCERPLSALAQKKLHSPLLRAIEPFLEKPGTVIEVIGYNDNERSKFYHSIVKDYILWYTKVGSVELQFGADALKDFKVRLKCLDSDAFETIDFGHPFPPENSDINKLFESMGAQAAGLYVKRYQKQRARLPNYPEVVYDAVLYVEGDDAKRTYNKMIREKGRSTTGTYRVLDRYGIWLCKDYIPIVRVNDWITTFGSGSNSWVLLHGFVNCQDLKLTANRGTIANTDPKILEELQREVLAIVAQINEDLHNNGLFILKGWQEEEKTLTQEKSDFTRRIRDLKGRSFARFKDRILIEPKSESELFGLLTTLMALAPTVFDFEPLDYNTTRGIDFVVRDKRDVLTEHSVGYAELKSYLSPGFNHAFRYLKWIVCWDFAKGVQHGARFEGIEEGDTRSLQMAIDDEGHPIYSLDSPKATNKISVVRIKELIANKLGIRFDQAGLLA